MSEIHTWADVDIDGRGAVVATSGNITLDALGLPYGHATITVPYTGTLAVDDMDPREDHRVIIRAGNSGHWEITGSAGYGHGAYGHGPYGGDN